MRLKLDESITRAVSSVGANCPLLICFVIAAALILSGCGGSPGNYSYGGGGSSPTTPSGGAPPVTIAIVGIRGPQSFVPNPATVRTGDTVEWQNNDSTRHHIVLDDGTYDSGLLEAGATSPPLSIAVAITGQPYHCTIHSSMVGQINLSGTLAVGP